jgi:hypothetical protein
MAMKKQQVAGGFVGILCIAAIVLAIVFGVMWGQCKDDRKELRKSCESAKYVSADSCKNDYNEGKREGCYDRCFKDFKANPLNAVGSEMYPTEADQDAAADSDCRSACMGTEKQGSKFDCHLRCGGEPGLSNKDGSKDSATTHPKRCTNSCVNVTNFRNCMNNTSVDPDTAALVYKNTLGYCQTNYMK